MKKNKKKLIFKKAEINGETYWVASNPKNPDVVGQGSTQEEAVNDYFSALEEFENAVPLFTDNDEELLDTDEMLSDATPSEFHFEDPETVFEGDPLYNEELPKKKSKVAIIIPIIILGLLLIGLIGSLMYLLPGMIQQCKDDAVYTDLERSTWVLVSDPTPAPLVIEGQTEQAGIVYAPGNSQQNPGQEGFVYTDPYNQTMTDPNATIDPSQEQPSPSPTEQAPGNYSRYKRDFDALLRINKDCVGWLEVKGTCINYPVVYSANSTKYLDTDFNGNKNKNGTIFATGTNGVKGRNIVFYGHRSSSTNAMFSCLDNYKDYKYFSNHSTITYTTIDGVAHDYKIFAVIKTSVKGRTFNYTQADFINNADFRTFVDTAKSMSLIDTKVSVPDGSRLICLSTCNGNDYRLVVIGYR